MLLCVWFSQVDFLNSVIVDLQVRFVLLWVVNSNVEIQFSFYCTDPEHLSILMPFRGKQRNRKRGSRC